MASLQVNHIDLHVLYCDLFQFPQHFYYYYFICLFDLPVDMNFSFLLFQDLCQLTNGEQPYWLIGIIEMTRTFGLELLESVLKGYPNIFLKVC